jgi:hypothetical protein
MLIALFSCCEFKSNEFLIKVIEDMVMDNLFYLDYKYLSGSGMENQGLVYVSFQAVTLSFVTVFGFFGKRSSQCIFRDGNATTVEMKHCKTLPVCHPIRGALSFCGERNGRLTEWISVLWRELDASRFFQTVSAVTVPAAKAALVSSK